MWVEYERFDFVKGRVEKKRRWVDLDIVIQNNTLLAKSVPADRKPKKTEKE